MRRRVVKIASIAFGLVLNIINLNAQELFSGDLSKYVGTWQYKDAEQVFVIDLKIGRRESKISYDCILGGYYYKQGNFILDHLKMPYTVSNGKTQDFIPIWARNAQLNREDIQQNELVLFFDDAKLGKIAIDGKILYLSPTTIRWVILDEEEADYSGKMPPRGASVPLDVVMTKVK